MMKTKKQERYDFERVVEFLKRMMALAELEISDCSYGEEMMRMGAIMGCDCGCGGDTLTPEDFEYERDESKYEVLLSLPIVVKDFIYLYSDMADDLEPIKEDLHNIVRKYREELEEVLYGD